MVRFFFFPGENGKNRNRWKDIAAAVPAPAAVTAPGAAAAQVHGHSTPQHVNHSMLTAMTRHGSCPSSSASRSACTSLCWAQTASMRALHSAHKLALVHNASFETEATVWKVWSRSERLMLKLKEPQAG